MFRKLGPGVWAEITADRPHEVLALVVQRTEEGWYGQAKFLDLALVTLPELLDAGAQEQETLAEKALACLRMGYGVSLGMAEASSEEAARSAAHKLITACKQGESPVGRAEREEAIAKRARMSFAAKRAERFRLQAPEDYLAGFLVGAARSSLPPVRGGEQEGEGAPKADAARAAFEAGWRHGWEYAVGRVSWPEWATSTGRAS